MSIAQFSVKRPVAATMRVLALVVLGVVCLTRLPVDLLPNISMPIVGIVTSWPNVAPEEIETQITRPIELAVSAAPHMYQVTSSSAEGSSIVRVQFQWGTDIGQAAVDVLQLVQRATRSFPSDPTIVPPTVFKFDPTQLPILVYGVSGMDDPVKLRTLLDNQIAPMLDSAGGVASAAVTGGLQRAIMVQVDPYRLQAHHFSLSDVMRRIVAENVNLPAGIAKQGETEYTIRSLGWFVTPEEIAKIPLGSYAGRLVALGDVANVQDSHDEVRLYTRLNAKPAVGIIITKQSGVNTIATAQAVFDRIKAINKIYPQLKFGLAYDQSQFIRASVKNVRDSAIIGGFLAVLILLFFLRNVRSTLVVAISIPASIISAFALIYIGGFTINTMSLGGLALATGLIVDDAVVVLENIFRHIERDKIPAAEAAVVATDEILSAVVASTWTVMVVFLPLFLIRGQAGQMYTQFALVVIFAMAVSLLDATTVVPMLASRLISGEAHRELTSGDSRKRGLSARAFVAFGRWLTQLDISYRQALAWAIRHRALTVGVAVAITVGGFLLFPLIGTELMPQTDSGDFSVDVRMPVGTALSRTNATMKQIERIVLSNPDVETAFAAAGSSLNLRGTSTTLRPYQGSLMVKLKDSRRRSTAEEIGVLRSRLNRIAGVAARPRQTDLVTMLITGGALNVEVDIFGDDLAQLSDLSRKLTQQVRGVPGLQNLDVNWQEAMPEIQWRPDRQKALQAGVSFTDISGVVNTATNGTIASYYQEKGFQYPIIVEMPPRFRKTVPQMSQLVVTPSAVSTGAPGILLSQVANQVYGVGPSEITRMDRRRYVAVTGVPEGRSPGDVQADIGKVLNRFNLPIGYHWDWGTAQKQRTDEFSGMALAVVLAIVLIYMLLASQFESLIHPLTILLAVPLAGSGVMLGLFLSGRAFGLTAFIGVLMLVGIVVKNGILLVDYTNTLRRRGMAREEALLTAGPTRLRPILMTASAAILGMLPLAIGLGKGSEIQAPMATAVIGGLITSTCLTLFIVPVAYGILDDLAIRVGRGRKS